MHNWTVGIVVVVGVLVGVLLWRAASLSIRYKTREREVEVQYKGQDKGQSA